MTGEQDSVSEKRRPPPVFVLGCGRSGTTVTGQIIGQHPDVLYLNEPRQLWVHAVPATDIWSPQAEQRGGRIDLDQRACTPESTARLHSALKRLLDDSGKRQLVEKLPINTFRIPFLLGLFPRARFIHVTRNGLDVADSIAKMAAEGRWYGFQEKKWTELVRVAHLFPWGEGAVAVANTPVLRGLLEWRLSLEFVQRDLAALDSARCLELPYEELCTNPVAVSRQMQTFLGLPVVGAVEEFAEKNVRARAPSPRTQTEFDASRGVGGAWLGRYSPTP